MKIQHNRVLAYLEKLQKEFGGYYGTDIANFADELGVSWYGIQKRISFWKKNDSAFKSFVYLGRNRPSITLNEFMNIESHISSNPLKIKQHILSDLQIEREASGKELITKTTFYRVAEQVTLSKYSSSPCNWFTCNKITMPEDYSVKEARESLSTIFTFSDMKTPSGPDIRVIYDKLSKAKEWFSRYKVEAIDYYSKVLTQGKHIRSLLTSIPSDQQKEVQARLIFECQVVFIVECTDLLIDLLIHEKGRVQQTVNKSRAKVENHILKNIISSMRNDLNDMHLKSSPDMEKIHALANPTVREKTKARMELLRKQYGRYRLILQVLDDLTNSLTEGVIFHDVDVHKLFLLAKDKNSWQFWSEKEKQSFVRNPDLVQEIDNKNEDVASLIAIDRIVDYIKQGKITFKNSYYYQDIGDKIKNVKINELEGFLTSEILEELVSGKFVINIQNRIKELDITDEISDSEPDDDDLLPAWINFSGVMQEVSQHVRATNTEWFKEHELLFRKQTSGLFSMEYNEKEFAERLYKAIGFLGRNFRYRDSEEFWNLKYFIQRYLTEDQMVLELKFIHRCIASFENKNTAISVIDTMGVNSRKKSILSTYHGRYNTIGFSDMRSVTPNMIPINSFRCHSTDSEAMNIVSVMDKIQTVCDDKIEIYTGDAHTVSRISAGMVFLSHGVVAAGRICHEPKKDLGEHKIGKLKENIPLLTNIGKMLMDEPSLGRVIAMKKHIYADGVDISGLVEDLGYLILQNVSKVEIPVDTICLAVERSNNLKKKARIVEGSYTRSRMNDVGLSLLSGELVLCIAGLYHMLNGWTGHGSPINFSDIRTVMPA